MSLRGQVAQLQAASMRLLSENAVLRTESRVLQAALNGALQDTGRLQDELLAAVAHSDQLHSALNSASQLLAFALEGKMIKREKNKPD